MITLDLTDLTELRAGTSAIYFLQSEEIKSTTPPPFFSATYEVKISRKSDCKWFIGYWMYNHLGQYQFLSTTTYPSGDYGDFEEIII